MVSAFEPCWLTMPSVSVLMCSQAQQVFASRSEWHGPPEVAAQRHRVVGIVDSDLQRGQQGTAKEHGRRSRNKEALQSSWVAVDDHRPMYAPRGQELVVAPEVEELLHGAEAEVPQRATLLDVVDHVLHKAKGQLAT